MVIHLGGSYFPPVTNTNTDAHAHAVTLLTDAVGSGYLHPPTDTDAHDAVTVTDALDTIGYIHTSH